MTTVDAGRAASLACRVALRPRSPLEAFDLAVRLLAVHAADTVPLAVATTLAPAMLAVWLTDVDDATGGLLALGALLLLVGIVQAPWTLWAGAALFGRPSGPRAVLGAWAASSGATGVVTVGALFIGAVTLFSCGLFGAPLALTLFFLPEVMLLERAPTSRAWSRASGLVRSHAGHGVAAMVLLVAWWVWAAFAMQLGADAVTGFLLQAGRWFRRPDEGFTPWMAAGLVLAQPLTAVARALMYVSVRTVMEGWDVQVAVLQATERGAADAATGEAP